MYNNEKGFTLIEMLIVLMIISVLIILIVPNLAEKGKEVNEKGCDALISVVEAQVDAYYIDNEEWPESIEDLKTAGYIKEEQKTCPNGAKLNYKQDNKGGTVTAVKKDKN